MRCSHEGACYGDRFLEVFTRRVLSQGHVVISFSDWFIFRSVAGTCRTNSSHEATLRLIGVKGCFVAATCPLNSNWFEFRGHVAGTKFRPRNKIFHENRAFTRWDFSRRLYPRDMSLQHVPSCEPTLRVGWVDTSPESWMDPIHVLLPNHSPGPGSSKPYQLIQDCHPKPRRRSHQK